MSAERDMELAASVAMLHDFVTAHRAELITMTRAKVQARPAPTPTEEELATGVPLFLDQLAGALRDRATPTDGGEEKRAAGLVPAQTTREMKAGASIHAGVLLKKGFTIAQVVHDYGDICQAVTELAGETKELITTDEFHTLNQCLDNAIAEAVTAFTADHDRGVADQESVRVGAFAHELRNRLSAATLGFAMIKNGTAPIGGSVAAVVARNLQRMKTLVDRSLSDVRVDSGNIHREHVALHDLLEEAEVDGSIEATSHGLSLSIGSVDRNVKVDVDPQILSGALSNLLQNAFKFTAPGGHIAVRTTTNAHVEISVEDECGGLPPGKADEIFQAFKQHGQNRSGLGLGLFISRKGIEACGGTLRVTDKPGRGCVFTIHLPRA